MIAPPLVLVAELTHRCPLRCAYCSNPHDLVRRRDELATQEWASVMAQAGALGMLQAHLSGGEPLLRDDLVAIAKAAIAAGLYTTLITSGVGAPRGVIDQLVAHGLRAIQVSLQDVDAAWSRLVAGIDRYEDKLALCRWVREAGASLTVNVVLHRGNLARVPAFIELALAVGADRLELAHVQLHGWARTNADVLLPDADQVAATDRLVAEAKLRHAAELEILYVMPDVYRGRPKPCMGGWGQKTIVVSPDGRLLPCHEATSLPLRFDDVRSVSLERAWTVGEAFNAFRGESWMEAPCKDCPERAHDHGGCRCQALAYAGRATAADPACARSPAHEHIVALRHRAPSRTLLPLLRRPVSGASSDST